MSIIRILSIALLGVLFVGQQPSAQTLTFAIFERYLDALRQQAGIPGLAGALVQAGRAEPVWARGFGLARVAENVAVTPDTPFPLADLTQLLGSAAVLQQCIESGEANLDDVLRRWSPSFNEPFATFRQVLGHNLPAGYSYDPSRFAYLTRAVEECTDRPYQRVIADDVLARFAMLSSVPGGDVAQSGSAVRQIFPVPRLNQYIAVLNDMARPYRVNNRRTAALSEYQVPTLTAADGLVSTVRDLARFDAALEAGAILRSSTIETARTRVGVGPTGFGSFVQVVNGRKVIWHFGLAPNAYSSLMIKVPGDGLTLFLLANSDGLSALFPLANGDVTVSPFAAIFFKLLG